MDEVPNDVDFPVRSGHRTRILAALRSGAHDRRDLRASTGASAPTVSRALADFEERHWVEREGHAYRLTDLGAYVADGVADYVETMTVDRRLREVWPWLPHEMDEFSVGSFTDVTVSRPGPGYPYQPLERLAHLVDEASHVRGFGMAMLKSGTLEAFFDRLDEGMECEYIYPPAVFERLLAWDERTVARAIADRSYTVLIHDDLPLDTRCGVCLFDERTGICCYDHETGTMRSMVDTGSEAMREWAESHYERYRRQARPLENVEEVAP